MRKRIAAMLLAILLLWAQPAFAHAEDAAALDDEAVDLCIQEGRYGDAITLLMSSDSEKVAAYYFKIAEKYLDENKMAELVALFKRASQSPNAAEDFLEPLYQKAVLFAASGNLLSASQPHLKAFQLFTLLGDYKDSAEKAAAAYKVIHAAPATATPTASPAAPKASATPAPAVQGFHQAQVGEYITFGAYEQDNNKSNGKEPIQWRVLAKENNRLLVISRYGLDCKQFSRSTRSWRKSDLRKWLNGDFLSQAFTPQELEQIPTTSVFTPTTHNGTEGDTTQDRVFLLSTQEAERYFKSDADRLCQVTAYAKKQKATTIDGDIGWWWLRSPGISEYSTVKVFTTGKIDKSGYNPNSTRGSIRPALWIEMNP